AMNRLSKAVITATAAMVFLSGIVLAGNALLWHPEPPTYTPVDTAAPTDSAVAAAAASAARLAAPAFTKNAAQPVTGPDAISDAVGATPGQFRVDESGQATYSIPLFTPPGVAGVVPKMALSYSSQGGPGVAGKGWAISGASSISRCRATREAGDFITGGVPNDGNPQPINFTASDQNCLDGQRLLQVASPGMCNVPAALSGVTAVTELRTEIDTQTRVCAYAFDATGPRFFTVERKDGSISWFGDRRDSTGGIAGDYGNGAFGTASGILSWNLTRFQDSTGNYIDYSYTVNPAGTNYAGEQHLARVAWTGKNVLPGQSGMTKAPTQTIDFNYSTLPTTEFSRAFASGFTVWQTQRLDGVTVSASGTAVRYYALTYQYSVASPHTRVMSQVQECSDATKATCLNPTTFGLSAGQTSFSDASSPAGLTFNQLESYKLGDVDGDGRQDIVWIGNVDDPDCQYSKVFVSFSELDANGKLTFVTYKTDICVPFDKDSIPDNWKLVDYNGDGREDLVIPTSASTWAIYPSLGRPSSAGGMVFDTSRNLLAGYNMPVFNDSTQVPDFADINGDGQVDAIYPSNGAMRARISERQSDGTWAWGQERTLQVTTSAGDPCATSGVTCAYYIDTTEAQHYHLNDFNGDSRADILMRAVPMMCGGGGGGGGTGGGGSGGGHGVQVMRNATSAALRRMDCTYLGNYLEVMTIQTVAPGETGAVTVTPTAAWEITDGNGNQVTWGVKFADINGDGLTDALVKTAYINVDGNNNDGGVWQVELNDGTGHFVTTQSNVVVQRYNQFMQLTDINGDGRADMVYPSWGSKCSFLVRYAQPDGTFGPETALPGAQACGNNDLTTNSFAQIFADFDGDGTVDYVLAWLNGDGVTDWRAPSANRFAPHDTIQTITNGYGAVTNILYTPLTNAGVYRPDNGSVNTLHYGRGSPVTDLLAPIYVVGYVESSAPVYGNPNALSSVYYRYAGAKMQAGGRGFLGFREITTIDANHPGQYVATTTDYRQDFPFIGSPLTTTKTVVNGSYAPPVCLTGINSADASGNNCFLTPGNPFTAIAGTNVSQGQHVWEALPAFAPGVQRPMQVATAGTEDKLRDLATGTTTSDVWTSFLYDGYGNPTQTTVDTYSDDGKTLVSAVVTSNTYDNLTSAWRLGRLRTSAVTHTRAGSSITRNTAFTYDTNSPAMTGLLLSEEIQPGGSADQDKKTVYTLDSYGNRIAATTCSRDIASCTPQGIIFQPIASGGPSTSFQRTASTTYDANGQYPVATAAPFWNGSGASVQTTQTVDARDALGDVTQAHDTHGVASTAVYGLFGRPYYTWVQTVPGTTAGNPAGGAESWTTYRWCGNAANTVSCPVGAVFRQQTLADGAPTKWTYYDVLGRPVLAVGASFNVGVTGQAFSGVCTYANAVGLSERVSIPFFLNDPGNNGPSFAAQTNPCGARNWAITTYDVLGRPLSVTYADGSRVANAYAGLTTTNTDALGHVTTTVKDALGETIAVTDSAGLTATYAFDAAGDLSTVSRNGGRGAIVTSYSYDTLGRKVAQTDADTGTYSYAYNAQGELLRQTDAKGQHVDSDYDARGRVWRKTVYLGPGTGLLESTSTFVFDTDPSAPGLQTLGSLVTENISNALPGSTDAMSRAYGYDALGRPVSKTHTIDGHAYGEATIYDVLGRVQEAQDATGRWLRTQYGAAGYALSQCEGDGSGGSTCNASLYAQTLTTDAWGHTLSEQRGKVTTTHGYDLLNGRLLSTCSVSSATLPCGPICTYTAGMSNNCPLQDEHYTWDAKGNLLTRSRGNTYTEQFQYDANDRLLEGWYTALGGTSYGSGAPTVSTAANVTEWLRYDTLGNLCQKRNGDGTVNAYTYTALGGCGLGGSPGAVAAGPVNSGYQLLQAGKEYFTTDANGSLTRSATAASGGTVQRGWDYDGQNHAVAVWKGASATAAVARTRWDYGPDGSRFRRTDDGTGQVNSNTLYLDNVERVTTGGSVTWRRTVAGTV
ncbi:MAG: VCBS repeat-containing protein, partial [Proteobacteria bacterium]|nr:VCBS repeat-containing protein [Pseudomonadota bacterium]